MDLRICRYFLAIVEEGSMNKAAKVLPITQPTLSRQIAQLEEELQVQLFERQSRSLHLTSEGLMLARRARELLELENKTLEELNSLKSELSGVLTIGTGEMDGISPLLQIIKRFRVLYPKVQVSIVTGTADQTRELIENGIADIGLFLRPANVHGLAWRNWKHTERWIAVVKADAPYADQASMTPAQLEKLPLIMPYRHSAQNKVLEWIGKSGSELDIIGYSSLTSNGAAMVLADMGVNVAIDGSPAYEHPDLRRLPLEPPLETDILVAWKERFPKAPIQEKFLQFLVDSLGDQIGEIEH